MNKSFSLYNCAQRNGITLIRCDLIDGIITNNLRLSSDLTVVLTMIPNTHSDLCDEDEEIIVISRLRDEQITRPLYEKIKPTIKNNSPTSSYYVITAKIKSVDTGRIRAKIVLLGRGRPDVHKAASRGRCGVFHPKVGVFQCH